METPEQAIQAARTMILWAEKVIEMNIRPCPANDSDITGRTQWLAAAKRWLAEHPEPPPDGAPGG